MFHSIRWQNDTHVLIYQENARDYWSYDINESELTFHYPRAESGEPQGEFELGLIYLSGRMVTMDREKAVYWIKRAADKGYKHAIRKLERLIGPTSVDQG
jgi:TPR repeat protein